MSTPALMVDEKIVSMGKVLKSSDIKKFLKWMNIKHKKAGAYCAGKKRNQYIDTCLYKWRYMYVDIYTRTDTWYEMA